MPAGRKKVPSKFHVLNGTDRPCRRNKDEPQPDTPDCLQEPPEYLSESAKKEWSRMGWILHNTGILTSLDYSAFEVYCIAKGHLVDAETEMGDDFVITGPKGGKVKNPLMAIINESSEICRKFLTEYGMTPSSRTKIKVEGNAKKQNKFSGNILQSKSN